MSHLCHAIECKTPVPPKLLMCKKHWYMVPKHLRNEVWEQYVPGQEKKKNPTEAYVVAAFAAIMYVAEIEELETTAKYKMMQKFIEERRSL